MACRFEAQYDFCLLSVFCCVGALAITGSLDLIDKDLLGWWLCERQVKSGGLNGRPEKLPDVSKATKSWTYYYECSCGHLLFL